MTYDEISTTLQIIGGVVLTASFAIGIAIIWAGIMAGKEKDAKVRAQEERIAAAQQQTEELRRRNLDLEDAISPRILARTASTTERLKKFAGIRYVLDVSDDKEAERLSKQIRSVLNASHWEESRPPIGSEHIFEGVTVEAKFDLNTFLELKKSEIATGTKEPSLIAAEEFTAYLGANLIEARTRFHASADNKEDLFPNGTIIIRIGLKSSEYFIDKLTEGVGLPKETSEKYRQEEKAKQQQLRREWFPGKSSVEYP